MLFPVGDAEGFGEEHVHQKALEINICFLILMNSFFEHLLFDSYCSSYKSSALLIIGYPCALVSSQKHLGQNASSCIKFDLGLEISKSKLLGIGKDGFRAKKIETMERNILFIPFWVLVTTMQKAAKLYELCMCCHKLWTEFFSLACVYVWQKVECFYRQPHMKTNYQLF